VRWFGEGGIPQLVRNWFDQCQGEISSHQVRTDFYFGDPGSEHLGIKIREGRLEIKQLTYRYGPVQLHRQVKGLVDQWRKFGFMLGPNKSDSDFTNLPDPVWVPVQKERQLRCYQVAPNGLLTLAALATGTETKIAPNEVRRCDVELTSILVDNRRWWSLALEASGQKNSTYEDLLFVFRRLASSSAPLPLTAKNSFSYPGWLVHL
jgi:hypothetical protein